MKIINHKLVRHTAIYSAAEIINKALPFMLLPILTRYLLPADFGVIATFSAYLGVVSVLTGLNVHGVINVNFFKLTHEQFRKYLANVLLLLLVSSLGVLSVVLMLHASLVQWLHLPVSWLTAGVLIAVFQFITLINLVLWQVEKKPFLYGIYQISQTVVNVLLTLVLVVGFLLGWEGRLIALLATGVLFGVMSLWILYQRDYIRFVPDMDDIKDALRFGVPLIPHALSGWLTTGMDRILIMGMVSSVATGLYSVGFQIGMILGVAAGAFNRAYSPFLFEKLETATLQQKIRIVKWTYAYFILVLFAALLLSLIAPLVIPFLLGKAYSGSAEFVPWIAFGYAFNAMYLMVVNFIFFTKKTGRLGTVTFSISLLHLLLSYLMIKAFGPIGAAQAMAISFFLIFCAVWYLSGKTYEMPWNIFKRYSI